MSMTSAITQERDDACLASFVDDLRARACYHGDVTRLMKFLGKDALVEALNRFSAHTFSVELNNLGLAPSSRNRALAYARDLIRWAFRVGIYPDDFGHALKSSRIPRTIPKVPTAKEMEAMLDGACPTSWPERDRCITELLYCNLRPCEVVSIELDNIAADKLLVKGKGRRERDAFLTPSASEALSEYLPPSRHASAEAWSPNQCPIRKPEEWPSSDR
jgi:site-specific recombinase XerD